MSQKTINYDQFEQVEIRVGRVVDVQDFPEARKSAYKLTIDFGPEIGTRRSSAQITQNYSRESLIGKLVLAVLNFPPKQIGPFWSECLTLGVADAQGQVVLITPDNNQVPLGGKLY